MAAAFEACAELVRRFEGCRLQAYLCPAGVPTIGWGATGPDVRLGLTWTEQQAEERLVADVSVRVASVRLLVPHAPEGAVGALADFAYNLGLTRLRRSTLLLRAKEGDWPAARAELQRWTRAGARQLPGLVLRRQAEAALM